MNNKINYFPPTYVENFHNVENIKKMKYNKLGIISIFLTLN